jgi:signal transduction histidine kinase
VEIDPEGNDRFLKTMYNKVLYINTFIDNLFELSRLEQAKERSSAKSIRFADWITQEFDSFSTQIHSDGLQYKSTVAVDPQLVITIHSHEIRRVIANLVHNACKFSPKGGTVHLQASSGDGEVLVCIEDEGMGISPEHSDNIFNRTYKVDPASPMSGSGLGLAIAKEIVDLHNGRIWIESHLGKGSRFYFKLPVV